MHFCNKTTNTVNVAMATDTYFDYHVWGWWQMAPDACKTPIGAELDTTGDTDYYYFGYDASGGTWTGSTRFCIDPNYALDFDDDQESACATGAHREFRSINTHDESDFTVNLTP
jgi:uncharacterized membrane protein